MRSIVVPDVIKKMLTLKDCLLAINISGGKDGQAMLKAICNLDRSDWQATVVCLHMHLGRAEWSYTLPQCWKMAAKAGIPLVVLKSEHGDLVDEVVKRLNKTKGTGVPFWMSDGIRYCTKSQKTNVSNKYYRKWKLVISAEGIRKQEAKRKCSRRATAKPVEVRKEITTKSLKLASPVEALIEKLSNPKLSNKRLAFNWHPVLDWSIDDVWEALGTSQAELNARRALEKQGNINKAFDGWGCHQAYVLGASRVSCALCVLADKHTLIAGAKDNPELLEIYRNLEEVGGYTFKKNFSLVHDIPL